MLFSPIGAGRGSSPHTRGAHPAKARLTTSPGIIPAYAGSTHDKHDPGRQATDHPRIRGEHIFVRVARLMLEGSSPHTRGAQAGQQIRLDLTRIIPAYAGSTDYVDS